MQRCRWATTAVALSAVTVMALSAPPAMADDNNTLVPNNKRLNDSVVANVFTVQHQAGCTNDVKINRQLQLAAQWHTNDVLNNRALGGDLGSDGSTPQSRALAAGYHGSVSQTVAINPALAINGVDIINRWYRDPVAMGVMADCANTEMGVWSANSLDRSVVVALYGKPE
ncbi:CAP domain-containing protein [Mycolicibacterium sp.]